MTDRRPRRPAAQRIHAGTVRRPTRSSSRRCRDGSFCAFSVSRRRPIAWRPRPNRNSAARRRGSAPALDRARDELSGLPLAGLVMVTDGADTPTPRSTKRSRASRRGRSRSFRRRRQDIREDIQVTRVETPRLVLKGTSLVVDVVLTQTGYAGQSAAQRRRRRTDRRHAGRDAAGRRRVGHGARALHGADAGPRLFRFKSRRRTASRSRRTTRATR